jgi:hypothetical protein
MKNHLFIGLGGQGGESIAALRKVFDQRKEDAKSLHDSGHRWDFLYIDSSRDVMDSRQNWIHFGKDLRLDEDSSFLYLKEDGRDLDVDALALKPDIAPWIGDKEKLKKFLEGAQGIQGANQRRRLGRILYAISADRIKHAICEQKIEELTTNGTQCAIHIFASLAGGTGSGSVVDLVTMLRTRYPNAAVVNGFPIFLYLYVTDEDFKDAKVGYFHQNQYSTLRDLNALACGRLKPTLLGEGHGNAVYGGAEPFTQVLLSSGKNNGSPPKRLKLAKQHQIVAESAFERIFAYCSGHLDPKSQKPLTGEDLQASFSGEPLGNLLRSFRFGSSGMRRWEVPTEEIHDLLANELYVSSFRQMLYQNWDVESGFLGERLPVAQSGQNDLVKSLDATVIRALIENSSLAEIATAMEADLDAVHEGIKKEGFKDLDLDGYETRLKERYLTHVGGQGVDELFKGFAKAREESITELISTIQDSIRGAWTRNASPLGLSYVPDAILALQESIRNRNNIEKASGPDNSALRARMEARKSEWAKMTALSRPFRQTDLARAHKRDLVNLLKSDLRSRAIREDQAILDRLAVHLGELDGDFRRCVAKFETWRAKVEGRRDELRLALRNLHEDDVANKCELSDEALESFIKTLRTQENHLRNTGTRMVESAIARILGQARLQTLGTLAKEREEQLWQWTDEIAYERAKQIHDTIVPQQGSLKPVLTSKLLDTLQQRYNGNQGAFRQELKGFVDSASCSIDIDTSQEQPKVIRGDSDMPDMPTKLLLLGLPSAGHPFAETLQEEFLRPRAGDYTYRRVYYHDDPTQIRLLFVVSWMGARFAKVTQGLAKRYNSAMQSDQAGDKAYFTNIDPSGEEGQRPPLLLPTPEERRNAMAAALWLGSKIPAGGAGSKLIEATEGRVVLLATTKDGLRPEPIGSSLEAAQSKADGVTIAKVCEAVEGAVAGLSHEVREEIYAFVDKEDADQLRTQGGAGVEYERWVEKRDRIKAILNQ